MIAYFFYPGMLHVIEILVACILQTDSQTIRDRNSAHTDIHGSN